MSKILVCCGVLIFCSQLIIAKPIDENKYSSQRKEILDSENKNYFGSDIKLNDVENQVNKILMEAKNQEMKEDFEDEGKFLPRSNFMTVKSSIEKSKVYQLIQKLPKGGLLHAHDVGTVSQEYIIKEVTILDNLYACDSNGKLKLKFFKLPDNTCKWQLLKDMRKAQGEANVNKRILEHMSMNTANPNAAYPDGYKAWVKFQSLFGFLGSFMRYKPVFKSYYERLLEENYKDKVMYIELRVSLPKLYDLEGKLSEPKDVVNLIKETVDSFIKKNPDFVGVKLIYSKQRTLSDEELNGFFKSYKELKSLFPSLMAGFDLVGHEDKGSPLKKYTKQLLEFSDQKVTFFHAGETDWNGLSTDENLIDAVLLNTKRIGHGYALPKHPKVMELVKEKDIAIEVNPISNQVLNLVSDLRNHPASILFAENYPLVVCSDDPGLWGAKGLSYDFYEAFMGIMSSSSDLRALKKLALNSIKYSALEGNEKLEAEKKFEKQWSTSLQEIIKK